MKSPECQKAIDKLKEENDKHDSFADEEVKKLRTKLEDLKKTIYTSLTPWQRVSISRHPDRPHTVDYIKNMCDEFVELFGDRSYGDDYAIIGGFATIGEEKFILVGQEKGNDTESRLKRNFGMPHPEGYRKALRLMKLAEKFQLPILCLVDTPGAYPGLTAEERGQGLAIATNLFEMAQLEVPIIITLIGEGCSGGALGIGVGDRIGMLEHSYYSVISPEGCASILWKDSSKNAISSESLKMNAEYLREQKIIDEIILEPLGGAHHDPSAVYQNVKEFILRNAEELKKYHPQDLINLRYDKFRKMGAFSNPIEEN